ncbi:RcnB family protein [Sphingomonas sp. dw_22]|uniref:RcnB family protein n=1 Tax=Sphingomonas sp. dw_22 TaxID=2721175 RepID=UPI001BD57276|nr:RcnB family protein [Sphingomonas sp. dw_22]
MKKVFLAAVAMSLVATPVLAAVPQQHGQHGPQHGVKKGYKPAPVQYRSWKKGQRFDSRYARNYRQIDYRRYRGLKAPPRGYRYVQSGNDAVLVGITSGVIAAVIANAIR